MKKYQIKYTSEKKSKSKMIKAEKISEAPKFSGYLLQNNR